MDNPKKKKPWRAPVIGILADDPSKEFVVPSLAGGSRTKLKFGAFHPPHHPVGEHPTLQLRRDLDFVVHLDRLGFDEFWCGEHHSSGWGTIGSPELFLASAGERTQRIRLGTGVVSLPYHHPFNVAERIVQLDHLTNGRVIFGTGPGASPADARTFGIDPILLRNRQDDALGVIIRLLRGERFSYRNDWFILNDAQLQLLPLQESLPMAAASSISPSGMRLAGKYGMGVLSIASTTTEGLQALPLQWSFAEKAAAKHGHTVDRRNWRVLVAFHLAETKEQAEREAIDGLWWWHNELRVRVLGLPGATRIEDPRQLLAQVTGERGSGLGSTVIGTPDAMIKMVRSLQKITGGFGVLLGFVHDWANREATMRSWELFARYVVPELNGHTRNLKASAEYMAQHRSELVNGLVQSVTAAVGEDGVAKAALAITLGKLGGSQ
ncbi:LLM class flavin-dependent oxidoreductase [Bradyrhizobium sp. RT10b]|uniref:LLM class flavin-dependent oxidoreductase n=1 Tax=Bradyrhizobium sp. RT10b TaxID=3156331 RepID=UPI003399A852